MLDLGCGRAELALRIIERFGSTVIAIDHSSYMLDAARERAEWTGALGRLHLDDTDIRDFRPIRRPSTSSVMLDAGGIDGGMAGICQKLRAWTRGGGYLLVGEGYWKRKPPGEFVACSAGASATSSTTTATCRPASRPGSCPMHAATASDDEWDEYEWKFCRSVERYVREQPDDPEGAAMLDRVRRWRDAYLRWGRDSLGFAAYLFYRPGGRVG